jgi:hypothetical protein
MVSLIELIEIAETEKPAFGTPCNHCGWCCLTEVCPAGQDLGQDKYAIPCKFLRGEGKEQKHYCGLMIDIPEYKDIIGASDLIGCDARTQREVINNLAI